MELDDGVVVVAAAAAVLLSAVVLEVASDAQALHVVVVAEHVNVAVSYVAVVEFEYMAMAGGGGWQVLVQYAFDVGDDAFGLAAAAVSACWYKMKPSSEQNELVGGCGRRHVVAAGTVAVKTVVDKLIEAVVNWFVVAGSLILSRNTDAELQ